MPAKRVEVAVEGRTLSLSNLDKLMYPATGFTKGQVVDYYTRVAPALLPHLRGRALTLKRYPDGVDGKFFYEKNIPSHAPEWVARAEVGGHRDGKTITFVVIDELAALVWAANLADLELHPSLAVAAETDRPTTLAFDLDPGPPATAVECAQVALLLREILGDLSLEAFAKTSGSKGMQVYVPLNVDDVTYEQTKPLAKAFAQMLESRHPELVVSTMKKSLREGKVFVDWSQNDRHKTTVAVYSLRAVAEPRVSTPLGWDEVEALAEAPGPDDWSFDPGQVLERIEQHGDLFEPVVTLRQQLPEL